MGFYIRTGMVADSGGQGTVLCAYGVLGFLAFAVLQDQARLLHVWPIRGALVAFVEDFVDKELGQTVGILYWLTYCLSFAALTATAAELLDSFEIPHSLTITLSVVSVVVPFLANLTDIRYLKEFEFGCGLLKLVLAVTFNTTMMIINPKVNTVGKEKRDSVFLQTGHWWIEDVCVAVFVSAFAFVGIEAIAATATEVDFSRYPSREAASDHVESNSTNSTSTDDDFFDTKNLQLDRSPFSGPAWLVPLTTTLIYLWGGWIVTENVVPNQSTTTQVSINNVQTTGSVQNLNLSAIEPGISPFVTAASSLDSLKGLDTVLKALLTLNVVLTSSTALYIASRTLYTIGMRHSGQYLGTAPDKNSSLIQKFPQLLIWKNKFQVPHMAVILSILLPVPISFVRYRWEGAIEKVTWFSTSIYTRCASHNHTGDYLDLKCGVYMLYLGLGL
ncbi:uncharacterized protein HMPREF1541_06997 [Cyphellophora europaea CBS 101466]|uniref:Amino acid permease/ SLC12A domain-containing protein n=1 Tax=Cyphellophora europaea (strain CBS 101466) TaxID=1220924 RepID=W2RRM2_CYPE1|nr:uncharacterized protein HMPREF1541_06997 [Cyphellophora europaea CBS 101466]ETN38955.1 hypothetical protein HMPREF1541_06997 [Cyphellophora europaea CBS 101466]